MCHDFEMGTQQHLSRVFVVLFHFLLFFKKMNNPFYSIYFIQYFTETMCIKMTQLCNRPKL